MYRLFMKYSLLAHRRYTYFANAVYITLPSKYICFIFSYFNATNASLIRLIASTIFSSLVA